jgi:Subtilase family
MRIAIIDTGVETKHDALKNCQSIEGLTVIEHEDNSFEVVKDSFEDEVGHGTSVLGIICQHISKINPFVVKLKGINEKFSEELLCEGLFEVLKIDTIKIINISMGVITDAPSERLTTLCLEAYNRNIFIVASGYSNTAKPCYPAYYENVFGVGKGYFMSEKFYQYIPDNKTNVLAKGTHQKIASLNNAYTFSNGTSFATAHFTGILYNLLLNSDNKDRDEIIHKIKRHSTKPIIEVPLNYTKTEEILSYEVSNGQQFSFYSSVDNDVEKVALFPINCSDLRQIILNKSIFDKEIVLGIDFPGCIDNVDSDEIPIIKRVPNESDLAQFDSVVVSNITDGYGIDDFKLDILRSFIVSNKNIVTWNYPIYSIIQQLIINESHQYTGKLYYPYYSENFMKESYLNLSLPPSENIPSLPIIKMEEHIESFIYQYVLSNALEKSGYNVSNIAIDPHGILYENIDIIFPFSTNRMVDLEWEKWGIFLRLAKRLIAYRKQPDIFISGVGNLLQNDNFEPSHIDENDLLRNTIFLKGIKPDAYIGVIDANNINAIKKTYTYLDSVLGIEPLFFITQNAVDTGNRTLKLAHKKTVRVVNINDSKKIVKMIENRFSN